MSLNWKEIDLILDELELPGAHIQKIVQPDFQTLVFTIFHTSTGRFPLLISFEPSGSRLHRTTVGTDKKKQVKLPVFMPSMDKIKADTKHLPKWKAKYNGVKEEVTSTKKEELEREGKLSELLELERNKSHEIQQQVAKMKRDNMKAALKYEVAKHAKDAHNIDDIVRNIDIDMIDYNEDNNSFANVDMAVDAVRKDRTYLFLGKSAPSMPSDRPSANVPMIALTPLKIALRSWSKPAGFFVGQNRRTIS